MTQETKEALQEVIDLMNSLAEAEGLMAKQFALREEYISSLISDNRSNAFSTASNEVKKILQRKEKQ